MARAKEMFDSQKDKLAVDWERQWQPTKDYWIAKARAELTSAGIGQVDFGMQSRSDAWERVAEVLGEVSPNWGISRNGMSGVECAVDEISSLAKAVGRADAGVQIAGWINEDALPDGYPYDVLFPHSKVDGVRLFPVYAPAAAENVFQPIDQAPKNGCGILALLPDSTFPVGIRWNDGRLCVAWDNSPLGEFDQPVKFMHIPDEDTTAFVVYLPRKLIAEAECLKSWHLRMAEMEIAAGVDISAGIPDSADLEATAADNDLVQVERGLLGAACAAIAKKRDAPNVLAALRKITMTPRAEPPVVIQRLTAERSAFQMVEKQEPAKAEREATPKQQPDIPVGDDRLLWGVVANAGRLSKERKVRWGHVSDATGMGSNSSAALCRRFGFDPDEDVGGGFDDGDEE